MPVSPPSKPVRASLALLLFAFLAGCRSAPGPVRAIARPIGAPQRGPASPPSATAAPISESASPPEDLATESDYPDEPSEDEGTLRTVASAKPGGPPCTLRVAPPDPKLHPAMREWIATQEARAARMANGICQNGAGIGAQPAASFACRTLARRKNATIVACYAFPNVMGNANPTRAHAIFTSGPVPKKLTLADMFVSIGAVCEPVGVALAARSPQLHERTAAEWAKLCRTSKTSLVAEDGVSIVGSTITFDTPYEFLSWGNAPEPLAVTIADLTRALSPRFAAVLADP